MKQSQQGKQIKKPREKRFFLCLPDIKVKYAVMKKNNPRQDSSLPGMLIKRKGMCYLSR